MTAIQSSTHVTHELNDKLIQFLTVVRAPRDSTATLTDLAIYSSNFFKIITAEYKAPLDDETKNLKKALLDGIVKGVYENVIYTLLTKEWPIDLLDLETSIEKLNTMLVFSEEEKNFSHQTEKIYFTRTYHEYVLSRLMKVIAKIELPAKPKFSDVQKTIISINKLGQTVLLYEKFETDANYNEVWYPKFVEKIIIHINHILSNIGDEKSYKGWTEKIRYLDALKALPWVNETNQESIQVVMKTIMKSNGVNIEQLFNEYHAALLSLAATEITTNKHAVNELVQKIE